MIYLKNNTETQAIYIPRQTVLGSGYIPSTKAYEKGYRDGLEDGKEQQKDKLSSLYVTENGQYEREDGWNVVNVDVPDLNGSYNEGYEQGKTEGINEQKGKLESISITENGIYSKEDGYNHIEVNVPDLNGSYEQGQADLAAKARVLNVTKNGTYLSKFSESIIPTTITGVYADGTEFYNYAQLTNKVFNTNIPATPTTRLELWYKGDNTLAGDAWNIIIGAEKNPDYSCYQIRYYMYSNSDLIFELGRNNLRYTWDENAWHHILIAKETENASSMSLWVDEVKIGDFGNIPFNPQSPFYINCIESDTSLSRNANGYFGMIKIDNTIIIPTADGFLNTNTGELLEVVKDGGYTFTENLPTYAEGELYKTINVNVPDLNGSYDEGKIDGINEQISKLETIEITANGTYNRGDGYNKIIVKVPDLNGSYDEGYEQGQADIASNAKVLNVTENGVYKTKFSDPILPELVTGVYADGTDFYNYAQLGNKVFNTNITVTQDSVVELWYKGDNETVNDWNTIFSCTKVSDDDFYLGYMWSDNTNLLSYLGQKEIQFSWDDNVWHHIIMKNDGLWIDDVLIGSFNSTKTFAYKLGLNSDWDWVGRHANGYYGMIKIDDVIIIPTADGFLNTNTGELLEVVKDGDYTFTKNLPTYGEGEIYKTINVNVPDLNGSYDEGKTDGVNEQKSKLETINITENGTYNREDGYNHIEVNVPTEAVSCNLEDKWVTPSMNDRDSNGYIVVRPSEGYDGLSRTVIDPKTIYNEGAEGYIQVEGTKWVTPSIKDVDVNGYIVVMPSEGYNAMSRVAINVSTIKSEWTTIGENSITNYYWCPLTVSDGGIGERAKYFSLADEQTVYDENDVLIDRNNMFYLPTANNLNEFRLTKKAVKIVFPFKNEDAQHIGNLYLNDDVEQFACADKNLSSLSIIEVGVNMARFTLSNCNLLNLNKIVVHSNNNCDVTLTHNVKSTGTLYVNESNQFKNNWINALPSGWTVEYI